MLVSPGDSGTVRVEQDESSSYPAIFDIENGRTVRLEAKPAPGYQFSYWEGHLDGTDNPATIGIDCDKHITAHFSRVTYILTIGANGEGSTIPEAGEHHVAEGAEVYIEAIAGDGWQLKDWTGDVGRSDEEAATVIMDSDKAVTANFSQVKPRWWLIGSITAGIVIAVAIVISLAKHRWKRVR